jgi:sulfane dehydrogenase subunit SoxC
MAADRSTVHGSDLDIVAGNGLIHRRMFLRAGTAAAAAVASAALANPAAADALPVEPWMKLPGSGFVGYGQPSKYEEKVARTWNTAPGNDRHRCRPHTAPTARRHDHAQRRAFRAFS